MATTRSTIPAKPRNGLAFSFSQDFAGFGGSLKYLRTEASFITYHPVIWDDLIGSFKAEGRLHHRLWRPACAAQ